MINNIQDVIVDAKMFINENKGNIRDFYRIGKVIGTGTFAQVRLAINKSNGAQRALKVITKNRFNPNQEEILVNEVTIHRELDHPNIIKMYEYFRDENRYFIITEICSGGELWLKIKKNGRISEACAKTYMKQILQSVNYMH